MNQPQGKKCTDRSDLSERLEALRRSDAAALLELLDRLPDERLRALLLLRHGLGLTWPAIKIAVQRRGLYYSERTLYRMYAQALAQAAALLEMADEI